MSDAPRPNGWLIHKQGRGWYRPNAKGYTADAASAGRYSYADAMAYSHPNGIGGPRDGISIKHESELPPELAPTLEQALRVPEVQAMVEALKQIRDMKPHHAGQTANECHMQVIARANLRATRRALKGDEG